MSARDRRIKIEIDDGRRYLDRTDETYDLITLDPPPPVEAAGSSMLYSKEFYESAGRKLKPGGILQTWLPGGDAATIIAVTRAIQESFPHVRAFPSVGGWGFHFMASFTPISRLTTLQLLERMPAAAVQDMTEWDAVPPAFYFDVMLGNEIDMSLPVTEVMSQDGPALTDDRPVNEFFFARRYLLTHP